MDLPERKIKLATKRGYNSLFEREVSKGKTQKEAFWEIENEYRETFSESKYSSFESFYAVRHRDLRNRLSRN